MDALVRLSRESIDNDNEGLYIYRAVLTYRGSRNREACNNHLEIVFEKSMPDWVLDSFFDEARVVDSSESG